MIPAYALLAFGFLLILAELMSGSLYLLFCGLGFLVAGGASFFTDMSWYIQLILAAFITLILTFTLKNPLKKTINKNEIKDDFLNESGVGEVKENMVYYKGTLWHFDNSLNLKNGDKVEILKTQGNKVILKG